MELVSDHMQHYESGGPSDVVAADRLDDYFDTKGDLLRERKRYIRQVRNILPILQVARFYQLENKLIANVDCF